MKALGKICMAASDIYPTTAINTCEGSLDHEYDERTDSRNTYCSTNHWAGAKKACATNGMRLPSPQELADVATYIYKQDTPIGAYQERSNITPDASRATELNWSTNSGVYWSSESNGSYSAYTRSFGSSSSTWSYRPDYVRVSSNRARCFSD